MALPAAPIREEPLPESAPSQDRAMSHFGGRITTGWKKSISAKGKSRSPRGPQMRSRSGRGSRAKEEYHTASRTSRRPMKAMGQKKKKRGQPSVKACTVPPVIRKGKEKKGTVRIRAATSHSTTRQRL